MKVSIYYQSGKITEFSTDTFCDSTPFEGEGKGGKNILTEASLRFDLLEDQGLMLHIYWHNNLIDEQTLSSVDNDVDPTRRIPHAGREPGRFIRLVSKDELHDIAKIVVDGEMVVWRQGQDLINAIKFYNQELLCYTDAVTVSVNARVMGIYSYLKNAYPEKPDTEIVQMFGYPYSAFARIQKEELAQIDLDNDADEDSSSLQNSGFSGDTPEEITSADDDEEEDLDGIGALKAFL